MFNLEKTNSINHTNEFGSYDENGVKRLEKDFEKQDIVITDVDGNTWKSCSNWEQDLHQEGKLENIFSNDIPEDPTKELEEFYKNNPEYKK